MLNLRNLTEAWTSVKIIYLMWDILMNCFQRYLTYYIKFEVGQGAVAVAHEASEGRHPIVLIFFNFLTWVKCKKIFCLLFLKRYVLFDLCFISVVILKALPILFFGG